MLLTRESIPREEKPDKDIHKSTVERQQLRPFRAAGNVQITFPPFAFYCVRRTLSVEYMDTPFHRNHCALLSNGFKNFIRKFQRVLFPHLVLQKPPTLIIITMLELHAQLFIDDVALILVHFLCVPTSSRFSMHINQCVCSVQVLSPFSAGD